MKSGSTLPGYRQTKGREKDRKDSVKIRERMVREVIEKSFPNPMSWEEAICLHVGYFSS